MIRKTLFIVLILGTALSAVAQVRSINEGVYSAAQATRGEQLYKKECASCHGDALQGTIGPPLVGASFLANWSARPLNGLVDKIQKTMPFNTPGSLSAQQSIDLTAYLLQIGKFAAGAADLTADSAGQIKFPEAKASTASGSAPEGNLAELMRAIAFPNANIIFNTQLKDPGTQAKKALGQSPFDYVDWGATIYPGWLAVDQAAVAITETAPLLLTPGRRCQNGKPVPIDREDWKQYVAALIDVGKLAHQLSVKRDYDAFQEVSEKLNDACANCHKVYRDKGGTEGSGVTRCQ